MTKVEKLNELKTYVRERMDFHNDWSGKSNIKKMFEELETELEELENELKEYRKLQSEDDQYWCKHTDKNGNKIPMTKVEGSRIMSKEEVEELNKIKLPF